MGFRALSNAELEQLTTDLFDELGRRKHQVKVLGRLTNEGLKNLGFRILEELCRRYSESSDDDKGLWDAAFEKLVTQLFPDLVLAFRQQHQFIRLGEALLEQVGPLI